MKDRLLPLGTVFRMQDSPTMLMIVGYYPMSENKEKFYRYYCVIYPIGVTEGGERLMCNEDAIGDILFEGFEDEKTIQFNQKLHELVELVGFGEKILSNLETDAQQYTKEN